MSQMDYHPISSLGCLHLLPSSTCSHGICMNNTLGVSWCSCDTGFSGISDMVGHNGADCAIELQSVRIVWIIAAIFGIICTIGGIYKLMHSLEASGPEVINYKQIQATTPVGATTAAAATATLIGSGGRVAPSPNNALLATLGSPRAGGVMVTSAGSNRAPPSASDHSPVQGSRRIGHHESARAGAISPVYVNNSSPKQKRQSGGRALTSASSHSPHQGARYVVTIDSDAPATAAANHVAPVTPAHRASTKASSHHQSSPTAATVAAVAAAITTTATASSGGTLTSPTNAAHLILSPPNGRLMIATNSPLASRDDDGDQPFSNNASAGGASGTTAINIWASPTKVTNYRAWIIRASRLLSFRLALALTLQVTGLSSLLLFKSYCSIAVPIFLGYLYDSDGCDTCYRPRACHWSILGSILSLLGTPPLSTEYNHS
jgi:hypothetical protein